MNLSWNRIASTGRYRLTVSRSANLSSPVTRVNTTAVGRLLRNLELGTYYWNVALVSDGEIISSSPTRSFRLTANVGQPGAPFAPGARIDMTDRNDLLFRWKAAPGARSYRLRLFKSGNTTPLVDTRVNAPVYRLTNLRLLDVGRFSYEITARAAGGGRVYESKPVTGFFNIVLRKIEKPKILIPDEIFVKKE